MSTGYQIKDQEGLYYLTFQVINWIDIFTRKLYRDIIIENLKYCQENHAIELRTPDFIREKVEYIHNNPVRAGIVEKPEDYLYSSARNYADMENVFEVIKIDLPWKTYT